MLTLHPARLTACRCSGIPLAAAGTGTAKLASPQGPAGTKPSTKGACSPIATPPQPGSGSCPVARSNRKNTVSSAFAPVTARVFAWPAIPGCGGRCTKLGWVGLTPVSIAKTKGNRSVQGLLSRFWKYLAPDSELVHSSLPIMPRSSSPAGPVNRVVLDATAGTPRS